MPYSTTISALDLSGGVPDVRVSAGYTWTEVGGPSAVERKQESVTLDIPSNQFLSQTTPTVFSYGGNLAPPPSQAWFIALWIQEIPRIPNDSGWLFRSSRFETEPPAEPIEVILAPESLIGNAELSTALGSSLPMTKNSTTINSLTLTVAGKDIAITAVGTDTNLPPGVTFTYTATLVLVPSGSLGDDSPFDIRLINPSLSFTAGTGTGLVTFLLNLISGLILAEVAPDIKRTIRNMLNSGVVTAVATRFNRVPSTTLPADVVLSIRSVRATTRSTPAGPESVIGVRAALGAFGGVLNKFPPVTGGGGGRISCFIATAALSPLAPEVVTLKTWRDVWLRDRWGGACVVAAYERLSPPLAHFIARSPLRRAFARVLIVAPAVRLARYLLQRRNLDMQQSIEETLPKSSQGSFQTEDDARIAMKEQSSHNNCR